MTTTATSASRGQRARRESLLSTVTLSRRTSGQAGTLGGDYEAGVDYEALVEGSVSLDPGSATRTDQWNVTFFRDPGIPSPEPALGDYLSVPKVTGAYMISEVEWEADGSIRVGMTGQAR